MEKNDPSRNSTNMPIKIGKIKRISFKKSPTLGGI